MCLAFSCIMPHVTSMDFFSYYHEHTTLMKGPLLTRKQRPHRLHNPRPPTPPSGPPVPFPQAQYL